MAAAPEIVINVFVQTDLDVSRVRSVIESVVSTPTKSALQRERDWERMARAGRYGGQQLPSLLGHPPSDAELESFNAAIDKLRAWERRADMTDGETTLVSAGNATPASSE